MARDISDDFLSFQGAVAGRYSLERELGRGGMGVVYLAHEVALDRPVALKVLPAHLAADERVRARFLQEARTAARLSHPHIVPIFTVDEVDGFVFFAMAFVEGETLGERVRARGPLSDAEAARVLREVAWALAYAHVQGVVHRDVKPDNILLEHGTGRALVTDFGIAEVEASAAAHGGEGHGSDRVLGTAEFMSPEQARGAPVDHRSDLYALGAVGFYALTGRAPFEASSPSVVLARQVAEPAPPVATVAPHAPTNLARTIDRCLRKEPERRFADGGAVAEALGHGAGVDRPLPVPLRVFIKHLRAMTHVSPLTSFLVLFWLTPALLGLLLAAGEPSFMIAALLLIPAGALAALTWRVRRVLKAGHTVEDVRLALQQDVIRRNEEFRFDVGARETAVDRVGKYLSVGGLSLGAVALVVGLLGLMESLLPVASGSILIGLGAGLFRSSRARRRADIVGERWLKALGGRFGDWLFRLGGLGLRTPEAIGAGTYRPTEMALSISAARLFEELPKETRRALGSLPRTVDRLEADARALRRQGSELDQVLHEIGDDRAGPGAEARARMRAQVEETRDAARARLEEVVAALETVRLGLLRMHAGERVLESVTMELEAAGALAGDMSDLLEGHREVERLLAERRATGAFSIVGHTSS